MSGYRFDGRSKEQFKEDIKERTLEERSLFLKWIDLLEKENGAAPAYKDTGCGKYGDFLEDSDVSTDPDFYVEGYGNVEVKFSKPKLDKYFHLKVSQVQSYLKRSVIILMVNGCRDENPTFTMLRSDSLQQIADSCDIVPWVGFGMKKAYRIPVNKFIWRSLQ
jgi:hypothetical protein